MNAQLAKEAEVRTKISAVQARMKRGLEVVYALTASNAERVEREVGELAQILLSSAFSDGSFLLDQRAFEVFMVSRDPGDDLTLLGFIDVGHGSSGRVPKTTHRCHSEES